MDPRTRTLVLGDSHICRLREFVEALPDDFLGSVELSMGLDDSSRLDLSFLGNGGRTVEKIRDIDLDDVRCLSPHVVILMVGGNDLCDPAKSELEVASDIHGLALSIAAIESCGTVLVGAIPPQLSYPSITPAYPERVEHCTFILRNLLEVEETISYFKIRGLSDPFYTVHINDGIHFNGWGTYRMYRAVRGAVCLGLSIKDRLSGGKKTTLLTRVFIFLTGLFVDIFLAIKIA